MGDDKRPGRVALVVHPTRPLDETLETVTGWAERHDIGLVQLVLEGTGDRRVAPPGTLEAGDLVVALGGDGTVLSALRATAATGVPVLGVACGSLGVLTAVSADELARDLERMRTGDWTARPLPLLAVSAPGCPDDWAINDFVVVRRGAGQVIAELTVDDERYIRLAGDGLVVATPAGSSGYSMAAGGPLLSAGSQAFVCTPVAMHGGCAPPLVVRADATLAVEIHPSYAGFDVEIDGHTRPCQALSYRLTMREEAVRLVTFSPSYQGLTRLRERGLVADSPRILARDRRDLVSQRDA
ncbi:MAG TPA: NAD(+)/NADH kinase [Thermoleophilaceae bacterium]|jgi:NAD+ kinase